VLCILLVSCAHESELPLPNGIPKSDIVFMPDVAPVYSETTSKTLGFINADGSNRLEYTFRIFGGSHSLFGERYETQQAYYPRWLKSDDGLIFSIADPLQNTRLIDSQGRMYGESCLGFRAGATVSDFQGNILVKIGKDDSAYQTYQNQITPDISLIARYDLKTCDIVGTFTLPIPFESFLFDIGESNTGLFAVSYYDFQSKKNKILIYQQKTKNYSSFLGYHPSLTDDGLLLAYYSLDGKLMILDTRTGISKAIKAIFSTSDNSASEFLFMPGWSPDQKWIVYNTQAGKIYKINIEIGKNIYLTNGWAPDWR
jgi:hypothetical protein